MRFSRQRHKSPPENVIPLINIIFLLLFFFMVAGHMERQGPFAVTPPVSGREGEAAETAAQLFLSAEGRVAWNGKIYEPQDFAESFSASGNKHSKLIIRADENMPANDFLHILEGLRRAGVENVHLVTRSGDGK